MPARREYFPRQINQYVPEMQYASDCVMNNPTRFSFGTPAAADADAVKEAFNDGDAGSTTDFDGVIGPIADARYGRNVTIAGTGATIYTIVGRDYLGQPMSEQITLSTGTGTGKKAFKYIDRAEWNETGGDAGTTIGWGTQLGLPYKCIVVSKELLDGVPRASNGTLTAPVLTDPQTATTGDPRGTYVANSTLNGTAEVEIVGIFDNYVNADSNGGFHGIKHFFS